MSSLYIMAISPQLNVELVKIYFQFCRLLVCLIINTFLHRSFSCSWWPVFLIGDLIVYAKDFLFIKFFPTPICSRLFSTLSPIRFSISGFILRSLIHWSWVVCKVNITNLFGFLYTQLSSSTSRICWRYFDYCTVYFCFVYQTSGVHKYVDLCLSL